MRSVAVALVSACLLLTAPVLAQVDASATPSRVSRDVEVAILGAQDPATPLEPAILEVARSLDVRVVSPGTSPRPVARAAIDLRGADVTLAVVDQTGQPVAQRSFPRGTTTEVLREELAIVLRDALVIAISRAKPPEPAPPPPPPPPVASAPKNDETPPASGPPSVRVDLLTTFAARGHDSNAGVVVGAGLGARVTQAQGSIRPGVGATIEVDAPFDAPGAGVDLRVAPYVARLLPSLEFPLGDAILFDLTAGPGLDIAHVTPATRGNGPVARDATTRVSPVVTGGLGIRARWGANSVGLLGGVDADLARRNYVVATPEGPDNALTPSRIRPFLLLNVTFAIHGGDGAT